MPQEEDDEGVTMVRHGTFLEHSELLSYEELERVVRIAVSLGMNKIRLTGGEPLVRKGILDFIHRLFSIDGLEQVRLTTNGVLLADYGERLYQEGVRYLNVSLDTLDRTKFKKITGVDSFDRVWSGLRVARDLGFRVKLNVVAMQGINDDEFADFARLSVSHGFQVRFIEFMPVGEKSSWQEDRFIAGDDIRDKVNTVGTLTPCPRNKSDGPAMMYDLLTEDGKKGRVGFISPISHHFCDRCNRLRLTSEGRLRACLLNDVETDLKQLIRNGAGDSEIENAIRTTILEKPKGHHLQDSASRPSKGGACSGRMSRIGG